MSEYECDNCGDTIDVIDDEAIEALEASFRGTIEALKSHVKKLDDLKSKDQLARSNEYLSEKNRALSAEVIYFKKRFEFVEKMYTKLKKEKAILESSINNTLYAKLKDLAENNRVFLLRNGCAILGTLILKEIDLLTLDTIREVSTPHLAFVEKSADTTE